MILYFDRRDGGWEYKDIVMIRCEIVRYSISNKATPQLSWTQCTLQQAYIL